MSRFELEMFAYAKVNLGLAITSIRSDGFHELQTVMQSIGLNDRVVIKKRGRDIKCFCGSLSGPRNLAYQAAALFQEKVGIHEGIELRLVKNIPIQAGLGGGSSDAAAVLMGLNKLYENPLSYEEILELSSQLGSDVGFCLKGGTQWAEGKGDLLSPLPEAPVIPVVIAKPLKGVNTALAYKLFDEKKKFTHLDKTLWQEVLNSGNIEKLASLFYNDLEAPSMEIVPEIKEVKDLLGKLGCLGVLMSGSGSTVFGVASDQEHASYIIREFRKKIRFECLSLKTRFKTAFNNDQ